MGKGNEDDPQAGSVLIGEVGNKVVGFAMALPDVNYA